MSAGNAIVVNDLTKKYSGNVALNRVSFSIKSGSVVGLIGPNGAGKSSILKILAGLIPGTSGDVLINGVSAASNPARAKKYISFMPENNPLPEHMRVGEYLRFRAELKGIPVRKIRASAEKVMRQCDLYYEARYRMIKTLSKGFRQRVGIADAMLNNSEIVILDEPTIGLDTHQTLGVRKIIGANKNTRTILISSHILSELETVCDHFIIINHGNIVAAGSMDDLTSGMCGKDSFCAKVRGGEDEIRKIFEAYGGQITALESLPNGEHAIKFSISDENYRALLAGIAAAMDLFLTKIGREDPSLEQIFLHATKRCRDLDDGGE
ncbi:MAG: ABC transporter ATP-binding protein [Puniceicoccales bacterium]|jgi:ABC-2 type transport system ATP-binding protein|nr:ABC transporter ATP-binding protein [Puniceicoccales bacterium]